MKKWFFYFVLTYFLCIHSLFSLEKQEIPLSADGSYIILSKSPDKKHAVVMARVKNSWDKNPEEGSTYLLSLKLIKFREPKKLFDLEGLERWEGAPVSIKIGLHDVDNEFCPVPVAEWVKEAWVKTRYGAAAEDDTRCYWSAQGSVLIVEDSSALLDRFYIYRLEEGKKPTCYLMPNLRIELEKSLDQFKKIKQPWRQFYRIKSEVESNELGHWKTDQYETGQVSIFNTWEDKIELVLNIELESLNKEDKPLPLPDRIGYSLGLDLYFDKNNKKLQPRYVENDTATLTMEYQQSFEKK